MSEVSTIRLKSCVCRVLFPWRILAQYPYSLSTSGGYWQLFLSLNPLPPPSGGLSCLPSLPLPCTKKSEEEFPIPISHPPPLRSGWAQNPEDMHHHGSFDMGETIRLNVYFTAEKPGL